MNPRTRRLHADYEKLVEAFAGHPQVSITPIGAVPPERYRIDFHLIGLALSAENRPTRTRSTSVEVFLPQAYPREQPYLTPLSAIFHPNFGSHVCIADHWYPGETLVDIVVKVARMIQWQTYNIRSPLNAIAARWVVDNPGQVPVGHVDVSPMTDDYRFYPPPNMGSGSGLQPA